MLLRLLLSQTSGTATFPGDPHSWEELWTCREEGSFPRPALSPKGRDSSSSSRWRAGRFLPASHMSHDEVLPLPSLPPFHVAEPDRVAGHTSSSAWLLLSRVMHVIIGDCLLININDDLY